MGKGKNSKSKKGGQKKRKMYNDPGKLKRLQPKKPEIAIQNPFEVRVNKRKHDNLGRMEKYEKGLPGVSRSKATENRKATLLKEYEVRHKSNVFMDNRIGEKNKEMPEDEKVIRRSAVEKARQYKKKSIFNLQEDEMLTHKGKALINIDRYEDPRDETDSEDERLNEEFVSDAHFSGFLKMKKRDSEDEMADPDSKKSRQDIIAELILSSKKRKIEKAKETDENYELITKLDDEFKNPEFRNLLMGTSTPKSTEEQKNAVILSEKKDHYDTLVKELQFESKTGQASDRLKTEEEVAQEEKEKLEQLEKERIRRMQMIDTDGSNQHRSADDLNDGFDIDEPQDILSYKDGVRVADALNSEDENEGSDSEESESSEEDKFSDLDSDAEIDEAEVNDQDIAKPSQKKKKKGLPIKESLNDVSQEDIPFVIKIHDTFTEYDAMIKQYGAHYTSATKPVAIQRLQIVLERIVTYNKAADRPKLPVLFAHLLDYTLAAATHLNEFCHDLFELCEITVPHLHSLLVLSPSQCSETFYERLKGLREEFCKNRGHSIQISTILLFQICPKLFPASDFRHRVMTPAAAFLLQSLNCKLVDFPSVIKIVYLSYIVFEFTNESKRYCPEVVNILGSLLACYCMTTSSLISCITPSVRPALKILNIATDPSNCKFKKFKASELHRKKSKAELSITTRLGIFSLTMDQIGKFLALYECLPSSVEIFLPIKNVLMDLKNRPWPQNIEEQINSLLSAICELKQDKEVLKINAEKPKPLKLYEPLIEENFDGLRRKKVAKNHQEEARLSHKVKKEMKSAVREIKKDTAFLATQQLKEQRYKDAERNRKVRELLGSLASQEGDYQKLKRIK